MLPPREFLKVCENCGTWFKPQKQTTRYCSHKCNQVHYKVLARSGRLAPTSAVINQNQSASAPILQNNKEFLSVTETSALLGISKRTLYRLISSGELPIKKIGSRTIILRKDIDLLFEKL